MQNVGIVFGRYTTVKTTVNTVDKMQSRNGAQALSCAAACGMPSDAECQHLALESSVAPQQTREKELTHMWWWP